MNPHEALTLTQRLTIAVACAYGTQGRRTLYQHLLLLGQRPGTFPLPML